MDARTDLFVTLTTEVTDLAVAEDITRALECKKQVFFQDIILGNQVFPSQQTRISFHGHGDVGIFGSKDLHFTPEQFSIELIKILEANKQITDIDLLSCNVGLIDKTGYSYAGKLQDLLQEAGYPIRVNTFVVDNTKDDVFSSFFVVGLNESDATLNIGKSLLKSDEFSLDILRKNNEAQMELYRLLMSAFEDREICNTKTDMLNVFYDLITNEDGNHVTLEEFTQGMTAKNYSAPKIAQLIEDYHIEFIDDGENEPHIKSDLLTPSERIKYAGYRENVANGICMYRKDVASTQDSITTNLYHVNKRISQLSEQFALARAEAGRECKDKLSNIRHYLRPIKELVKKLDDEVVAVDAHKSTVDSSLVINSIFHPSTQQAKKEAVNADELKVEETLKK